MILEHDDRKYTPLERSSTCRMMNEEEQTAVERLNESAGVRRVEGEQAAVEHLNESAEVPVPDFTMMH